MWRKIILSIWLITTYVVAEELYEEELTFEFDPNFEDDFDLEFQGSSRSVSNIFSEKFNNRDFTRFENSLSLFGGNETIDSKYYLSLFPQGRFSTTHVSGHFGVPLRFAIYDNDRTRTHGFVPFGSFIRPREQDFQSFWDIEKILRGLQVFSPQDAYFFRLSRSHSLSFGHQELLNLEPDGLYDQDMMFLSGHVNFGPVKTAMFLGPLIRAQMIGLSSTFTPLSSIKAPDFVRGLSFEISYINDFMAPNIAQKDGESFVLDDEKRLIKREYNTAQGLVLGVGGEHQALSFLKLKPYASLGQLWLTNLNSYGGGLHVGHDLVFDFMPGTNRSVLELKTEARAFTSRYCPGYFGPTYMIDRQVENQETAQTKSLWLSSIDDGRLRFGYLFGIRYAFDEIVSAALEYENAHAFAEVNALAPLQKLSFTTRISAFERLRLLIGYQATSIRQFDQLFDFHKSRGLLSLRGQVKLLEYLYFDAWTKHSFGVHDSFAKGDISEPKLSNLVETPSLNFGLGLELSMTF